MFIRRRKHEGIKEMKISPEFLLKSLTPLQKRITDQSNTAVKILLLSNSSIKLTNIYNNKSPLEFCVGVQNINTSP